MHISLKILSNIAYRSIDKIPYQCTKLKQTEISNLAKEKISSDFHVAIYIL